MYNAELKQQLVNNEKYQAFCYTFWSDRCNGDFEVHEPAYYGLTDEELLCCIQLRDCKKHCWSSLYDHVSFLFNNYDHIYFATFTFNEFSMSLKSDTRRQVIHRMLNKYCDDYIANIDYGDTTNREHYHAIIVPNAKFNVNTEVRNRKTRYVSEWLDQYSEKYGFYKVEPVKTSNTDVVKLSRYIAKLCNHSIKVKQTKIMTKIKSKYHWSIRHNQLFNKIVRYDEDNLGNDRVIDNLEDVFGVKGFDIVCDTGAEGIINTSAASSQK